MIRGTEQSEVRPGPPSPVSSNILPASTLSSSVSHNVSSEEARLRVLCEQLLAEKQAAMLGKIMGEVAHKKEVDALKQTLDDLQRKCESLSESTPRDTPSVNQPDAIMAVEIEEAATNAQSEKEKSLMNEVERLKSLVSQLEKDKLAANFEMEMASTESKEKIEALKAELEEVKSKSRKTSRSSHGSSSGNSIKPLEVPDSDDEVTHIPTKKRRVTIDLT